MLGPPCPRQEAGRLWLDKPQRRQLAALRASRKAGVLQPHSLRKALPTSSTCYSCCFCIWPDDAVGEVPGSQTWMVGHPRLFQVSAWGKTVLDSPLGLCVQVPQPWGACLFDSRVLVESSKVSSQPKTGMIRRAGFPRRKLPGFPRFWQE